MIRPACDKDILDILEIYNEAIINSTAVYDYLPVTLENRLSWFKERMEDDYPVLVFEVANRVVGFSTYGSFRSKPAYQFTVEHSVFVHKDFRGRKIGYQLMKALLEKAESRDVAVMIGCIDADNKESIRLHEKLGFSFSGLIQRAGFKFGRYLDVVFYQYNLKGPER